MKPETALIDFRWHNIQPSHEQEGHEYQQSHKNQIKSRLQPLRFVLATWIFFSFTALLTYAADSAKTLVAAGRVDEAIATLQQQIARTPTDADAYNLLCRAYFEL